MFFSFGKKRKTVKKVKKSKGGKKPPARLIRMCKKHGIKCTRKIGKRRVYKKVSVLKKQLRRKKKMHLKKQTQIKKTKNTRRRRTFRFGSAAPFMQPSNYGYNQPVQQNQGILSQSSQVVTPQSNENRPPGFTLESNSVPTIGVYRPFFSENVPTTVGPTWNFMGQPDNSLYPVGGPFSRYTAFGKRRKNRSMFGSKCEGSGVYPKTAFGKRRRARQGAPRM